MNEMVQRCNKTKISKMLFDGLDLNVYLRHTLNIVPWNNVVLKFFVTKQPYIILKTISVSKHAMRVSSNSISNIFKQQTDCLTRLVYSMKGMN